MTSGDIITGWDELFTNFSDLLETEFADYLLDAKNFVDNFNDIVGGTGINIETKYGDIDHNASGDINYKGGITEIGEKGPEIVRLPAGSEILNNSKTTKLHNMVDNPSKYIKGTGAQTGDTYTFSIDKVVYDGNDYKGFVDQIIGVAQNYKIGKI